MPIIDIPIQYSFDSLESHELHELHDVTVEPNTDAATQSTQDTQSIQAIQAIQATESSLESTSSASSTDGGSSTFLITFFMCWTILVYIINCIFAAEALTIGSMVFQMAIICFSGFDGVVYGFKTIPTWVFASNVSIQTGGVAAAIHYNTSNNVAIECNIVFMMCKLVLMVLHWGCLIQPNNKIVRPAPWDDPIDLSDSEQPDWTCAICLESQPRRIVKFQNCMHMMHPECAKEMLKFHTICPECKKPLH